jgi:hypothetical protein
VAAFAVSCYASSQERTLKPFNPLLGETFEYARADLLFIPGTFCPAFNSWNFSLRRYARADLGFRYVSEKVAGSPTTAIAFHAESFDSATFDADEVSTQASKHARMYVCMVARMRGLLAFPADRLADKRTGCG